MSELILVGDRVLLEPVDGDQRTDAGLYLPKSVAEREQVRIGRVVSTGPGYLMANPEYSEDEVWKSSEAVRYLPLQAQAGDLAYYLHVKAVEITHEGTTYDIVHHQAILALARPDVDDIVGRLGLDEGVDDLID